MSKSLSFCFLMSFSDLELCQLVLTSLTLTMLWRGNGEFSEKRKKASISESLQSMVPIMGWFVNCLKCIGGHDSKPFHEGWSAVMEASWPPTTTRKELIIIDENEAHHRLKTTRCNHSLLSSYFLVTLKGGGIRISMIVKSLFAPLLVDAWACRGVRAFAKYVSLGFGMKIKHICRKNISGHIWSSQTSTLWSWGISSQKNAKSAHSWYMIIAAWHISNYITILS